MDVWRLLDHLKHEAKTISEAPLSFMLFLFIGLAVGAFLAWRVQSEERTEHEATIKNYEASEKSHAATVEALNQRLLLAQDLLAAERSRKDVVTYQKTVINKEIRYVTVRLEESGSISDASGS